MQNYQADGALYGRRLINRASPVMVAIVTDILKWQYEINVAAALENITITKLVSESGKILVTQTTSKQIIKE